MTKPLWKIMRSAMGNGSGDGIRTGTIFSGALAETASPYIREFMDGMQIMTCRPLQEILPQVEEAENMDKHISACGNLEKGTVCVYLPSGGETVLELGQFWNEKDPEAMEVWIWWYNPREGAFYNEHSQPTEKAIHIENAESGKFMVSAPTAGEEQDWILIILDKKSEPPVKKQVYFEIDENVKEKKVFEWV